MSWSSIVASGPLGPQTIPHSILSLPLKNGGEEKNMCSLNSIVQLLRHIPEFVNQLNKWNNISDVTNSLIYILSKQGSQSPVSALRLRQDLANIHGSSLNSGEHQDPVELLGFLLEHEHKHCPNSLFVFETGPEQRFKVNGQPSPCPECQQFPP